MENRGGELCRAGFRTYCSSVPLAGSYPEDKSMRTKVGTQVVRVYAVSYSEKYHLMLDGQVRNDACNKRSVASRHSGTQPAWLEAGQPDLPIDGTELPALPRKNGRGDSGAGCGRGR